MNNLKILKFGGSSVGTAQSIRTVSSIIRDSKDCNLCVVVSAQQGITDMLLNLISEAECIGTIEDHVNSIITKLGINIPEVITLFGELKDNLELNNTDEQMQDLIASFGERISARIIAKYLNSQNLNASYVDAREILVTDSNFTSAKYDLESTRINCQTILKPLIFENNSIPIVTGFIGRDINGNTTTLGRGGSDLTATLLGQCLDADVVELWTDVDGIMSTDPRIVKNSTLISELTYKEVIELSNFGAKVVYARAIIPAMEADIPVDILNTFNTKSTGTRIQRTGNINSYVVTSKKNTTIITIYNPKMINTVGYLAKLFTAFNDLKLSIDVISVSEASVSVTVQNLKDTKNKEVITNLSKYGEVDILNNCATIAVISNTFQKNQELFSVIWKQLCQRNIHIDVISYGNSELNLTLIISDSSKVDYTVNEIHKLLPSTNI